MVSWARLHLTTKKVQVMAYHVYHAKYQAALELAADRGDNNAAAALVISEAIHRLSDVFEKAFEEKVSEPEQVAFFIEGDSPYAQSDNEPEQAEELTGAELENSEETPKTDETGKLTSGRVRRQTVQPGGETVAPIE